MKKNISNLYYVQVNRGVAGTVTSKNANNLLTPSKSSMNYLYGINSFLLDFVHIKFIIFSMALSTSGKNVTLLFVFPSRNSEVKTSS